MNLLDKKYAILHKPTGMFLQNYKNDYDQQVKGATGKLTARAVPIFAKIPRFYNNETSAENVVSRMSRTSKDNRETTTKAVLFGSENALDYEVVEIDISWDIVEKDTENV